MGKIHSKSFFGQNTGLIINSSSNSEPYFFIRCIKKKHDGTWEKSLRGEGKVIKCSLEEIVMMLEVLNRKCSNWSSYHSFKDNQTQIAFEWEDEKARTLWIKIDKYSKMLNFAQAEILRRLLNHFLEEKIVHATVSSNNTAKNKSMKKNFFDKLSQDVNNDTMVESHDSPPDIDIITTPIDQKTRDFTKEKINVDGSIQGETKKALLIQFNSGDELWIPKSTIHGKYVPKKNKDQKFLIDDWILKKNKIIS